MHNIKWAKGLTEKDLDAAFEFLTLLFDPKEVKRMIELLDKHKKDVKKFKAKDILRASNTQLLPETNQDVRKEFNKFIEGEKIVPVTLVRCAGRLMIADGYHRTCAAYYLDSETEVHCVLVGTD